MRRRTPMGSVSRSWPSRVAVPRLGANSPLRMDSVVVLPAPLMPSRPKHWPVGMPRLTPRTANLPPAYLCRMPRMAMSSLSAPPLATRSFSATTSSSISASSSLAASSSVMREPKTSWRSQGKVIARSMRMAMVTYTTDSQARKMMSYWATSLLKGLLSTGMMPMISKMFWSPIHRMPRPRQNVGKSRKTNWMTSLASRVSSMISRIHAASVISTPMMKLIMSVTTCAVAGLSKAYEVM
mmetsp:Transcript_43408/g.136065  ORF Transcript_43408/g.136065 Transcript_43408/m.136065 type:complete len:239 (-) Transcript_43408:2539-3255(-)